jgi:tripartite-type tricarboxylate transporter receptor subunit TctC
MMELFKATVGIDLVHVPYKSNAAAVTDLMSGQVSLMFTSVGVALPLAQSGRIRILAAGAAKRAPRTPNVPSLVEAGVRDFDIGTWFAMLVPKGTPREVRAKLNTDVGTLLQEPAVAEVMTRQGMTPAGGTPDDLHDLIRSDFERWNKIVRNAKISAD